jgi:hypothetical protein
VLAFYISLFYLLVHPNAMGLQFLMVAEMEQEPRLVDLGKPVPSY